MLNLFECFRNLFHNFEPQFVMLMKNHIRLCLNERENQQHWFILPHSSRKHKLRCREQNKIRCNKIHMPIKILFKLKTIYDISNKIYSINRKLCNSKNFNILISRSMAIDWRVSANFAAYVSNAYGLNLSTQIWSWKLNAHSSSFKKEFLIYFIQPRKKNEFSENNWDDIRFSLASPCNIRSSLIKFIIHANIRQSISAFSNSRRHV